MTTIKHGSPEWHALRATRIGASEIAAVLGKDRYCSPVQLFMRKRMEQRRPPTEDHRDWGSDMEPAILRNYARRNGYELMPSPGLVLVDKLPHLCATPDGLGVRAQRVRPIQAKNVEEHHMREWGEPGTAAVPHGYFAQVTVEVGLLRAAAAAIRVTQGDLVLERLDEGADIAVSFGGRPPLGYPVPFDAELFGNLSDAAARFVRDYLVPDKVPPLAGDVAALEYVKARWRKTNGEILDPTPETTALVGRLRELKARIKTDEGSHDAVQAELCALIGAAYGIEGLCTWGVVPESRALLTDWPLVVESLTAELNKTRKFYNVQEFDRDALKALVASFTHEEVTRESYRRLTLAKERKTP